jgi:hypothetical protein
MRGGLQILHRYSNSSNYSLRSASFLVLNFQRRPWSSAHCDRLQSRQQYKPIVVYSPRVLYIPLYVCQHVKLQLASQQIPCLGKTGCFLPELLYLIETLEYKAPPSTQTLLRVQSLAHCQVLYARPSAISLEASLWFLSDVNYNSYSQSRTSHP